MDKKLSKRKKHLLTLIICVSIFAAYLFYQYISRIKFDEDLPPLVFEIGGEETVLLYYLQDDEKSKELKTDFLTHSIIYSSQSQELLFEDDGYYLYSLETGEKTELFSYEKLDFLNDSKAIEEIRFVPDSDDVSFSLGNIIYIYDMKEKTFEAVYEFDDTGFERHNYAFEWKNPEQIYLNEDEDLVLLTVATGKRQVILQDIGKVYFHISQDGNYLLYQNQCRDHSDTMLVDLRTKEEKKIHNFRYPSWKVEAAFSPDEKYLIMRDYDYPWEKEYWYVYDIQNDKKQRVRFEENYLNLRGW